MKVIEQNVLRKRVFDMLGQHPKSVVVNHFLIEGYNRSTIYNMCNQLLNGCGVNNIKKPGRNRGITRGKITKIVTAAKNKIGVSSRKLARKFKTSQSTILRLLKKEGVKRYSRAVKPKYSEKQLMEIPAKCRRLRRNYLTDDTVIIMDDEKYFTFSNSTDVTNRGFYTNDKSSTPDEVKFARKSKFEPKVLVWATISVQGVSSLYVQTNKGFAVNSDVYTTKCLPKMINFIKKKHKDDKIIFWPDLASCHYSEKTRKWLESKNVPFVAKVDNPPNVPQARPIEFFWSILNKYVYENGWQAKSAQELKSRITRCAKKIDVKVVQTMMSGVKRILRKIEDEGPLAV